MMLRPKVGRLYEDMVGEKDLCHVWEKMDFSVKTCTVGVRRCWYTVGEIWLGGP